MAKKEEDDDKAKMMMMRRATFGCAFWCHRPLIIVQVKQAKENRRKLIIRFDAPFGIVCL